MTHHEVFHMMEADVVNDKPITATFIFSFHILELLFAQRAFVMSNCFFYHGIGRSHSFQAGCLWGLPLGAGLDAVIIRP